MSQQPAARVGDATECPKDNNPPAHVGGKIVEGSSNVTINGKAAARLGDAISGCEDGSDDAIAEGSSCVTFNGRPAARVGDATDHGGSITAGAGSVVIGTGGSPVRFGNFGKIRFGSLGRTRIGGGTFSPEAMGLPPLPVNLDLIYQTSLDAKPIANAHYSVSFVDGTVQSGQLDANGYAHLSDVPSGPCKICYSTHSAADTKPGTFETLTAKRESYRDNIKKTLAEILSGVKKESATKQKTFDQSSFLSKGFILADAALKGGYDVLSDTASSAVLLLEGVKDVTHKTLKVGRDFITTAITDSPQKAAKNLQKSTRDATQSVKEWINATTDEMQTALWVMEDDEMRDLITNFVSRYWQALDTTSKTKTAGGGFMFVLLCLITKKAALPATNTVSAALSKLSSQLKYWGAVKKSLSHIKKTKGAALEKLSIIEKQKSRKEILLSNSTRGKASEARVLKEKGLTKNNEVIKTSKGNSIPDAIKDGKLYEIKDTKRVDMTKQMRSHLQGAKDRSLEPNLITGNKTYLPRKVTDNFNIERRPDLGPK